MNPAGTIRAATATDTAEIARLAGWIAAERRLLLEYGERAEIVGLVVGEETRRNGVGRALVSEVERWAAAQGLAVVTVRSNVVRVESHPFYESLGYARGKTQHVYAKRVTPHRRPDSIGASAAEGPPDGRR